ncbi:MAG: GFA family protein [Rubellimicrobium sp.]|nr:GFA family protein [Rubellimicrobium sp.]
MLTGRCLCGDVTYTITAPPQEAGFCHCGQCRRQSGHVWASAIVAPSDLAIDGRASWYISSDHGERGFCPRCGSFLFWRARDGSMIGFSLGSLDAPTGIVPDHHIYAADKGDYYDIHDGLPQYAQDPP